MITHLQLEIPSPLIRCMESCAVLCIIDCCGLKAFDTDPKQIRRWMNESPKARIEKAALQAELMLKNVTDVNCYYSVPQLNHITKNEEDRQELLLFIDTFSKLLNEGLNLITGEV